MELTETAYAKINLALHVRARRDDGYHEIETLFAFVDAGDELTARRGTSDSLQVRGEFADALIEPSENLVMRALSLLPRSTGLDLTLEKNLPVAAGLGGGSADAGAVFRLVRDHAGLPSNWHTLASEIGADVPACVTSDMAVGRGTGTNLEHVPNDMAGMAVLLVNPRIKLSTSLVFKAWDGQDRGGLPSGTAREISRSGRNDLRPPAVELCPPIAEVLDSLNQMDPWMCEMSGSGATCFSIYEDAETRDRAAAVLAQQEPGWWQMKGNLR